MNQPEPLPAKYFPFTVENRISMGWYPVEVVSYNITEAEIVAGYTLAAESNKVVATAIIRNKTDEELASEQVVQDVIEDKNTISNDDLIAYLRSHTLSDIQAYVETQFSALADMEATTIDNYLNTNVVDLASAKTVLAVLAKDLAESLKLLKVTTRIATYLIKKEL
jgi:hypothetical protein